MDSFKSQPSQSSQRSQPSQLSQPPQVKLEKLNYSYPYSDSQALSDIELEIKKGEFVLLAGPSGCGKSTLVRCLNRLVPEVSGGCLSGKVLIGGKDINTEKVHKLAFEVGMVFQNPETQLFSLTVGEDIAFGPENLGLPGAEVLSRVEKALKTVKLEKLRDRFIFTLSGGEKQRTAVGGNLAMEPDILVLDEPTSDLDPSGTREILTVLRQLNLEKQITIILIEHKLDEVFEMADRMLVMDEGRLVLDGKPFEIFSRESEKLKKLGIHSPQLFELAHFLGLGSEEAGIPSYTAILNHLAEVLQNPQKVQSTLKMQDAQVQDTLKIRDAQVQDTLKMQDAQKVDIQTQKCPTPSSKIPHIQFEGLCFRQEDGSETLKNISLKIMHGEFIALLGHNGAGKTTLAGHLIGFFKASRGRVLLNGKDIKDCSTAQLAQHVGYLFQNPDSQIFTDSVFEEISFGLKNLGIPEEEIKKKVNAALEMMELSSYRDRHPHALSRGQRQRLAVASIFALEPDLLVLDEPTTGQDRGHIRKFLDRIRELNKLGKTVILITHDMELAAEYAERVIVLKKGEVLLDGQTAWAFSQVEELSSAGLVPPLPSRLASDLRKRGIEVPHWLTVSELENYLQSL